MRATFDSDCDYCGYTMREGDEIVFADGGWQHAEHREVETCLGCWQQVSANGACGCRGTDD